MSTFIVFPDIVKFEIFDISTPSRVNYFLIIKPRSYKRLQNKQRIDIYVCINEY